MKDLISIIVPIYNTEKYLDKCLNSLLNQTYDNIEIILVEDKSTDNSKKLIDKYKDNEKIKILYNEKNSGLSFSRNRGLDAATGKYIGFIDSDDYVDVDFYKRLHEEITTNHADVAVADIKVYYEDTDTSILNRACNNTKNIKYGVVNNGLAASACNKLFKKEAIKNKFAVGKINEDLAVILPAVINSNKVTYVQDVYYYYVQHRGSIQNSGFSMKRFDIFDGVDSTIERIDDVKNKKTYIDAIIYNQIIVLLIYVILTEKNIFKRWKHIVIFNKKSKKYKIRLNPLFWEFLEEKTLKRKMYYKIIFKLMCNNLYISTNIFVILTDILYFFIKIFRKKILKKNIRLDDLVKAAKKNSKLKNGDIKISVAVPNYNYEKFIYQRLYSILNQDYHIYELIILDDCSKDKSREIIDEVYDKLKDIINIKKKYNEENSGSAFKAWQKSFTEATGEYVWIAEADDYCDKKLLSNLVKPIIKDKDIILSYANTTFIDIDGNIILKSVVPQIDIMNTGHWNNNFINDGIKEIENYMFLNCTVANVSSAIIKNSDYTNYFLTSGEYKQAGDWLFYVNVISNGKISYINKKLNYYRVHGNNVSSTMNQKRHIEEITKIYSYVNKNFKISKDKIKKQNERLNNLKKVWL